MNKQELIKKYEGEFSSIGLNLSTAINLKEVWVDILELDEPQKQVVPQFVADWIKKCKTFEHLISLSFALNPISWEKNRLSDECIDWLKSTSNQETFAQAWIFGYTVEKEKRYRVKVKGVYFNTCLIFEKINKTWLFSSIYETDHQRGSHTRNELEEAGFGWVFDCPGMEVEEVAE